MSAERASAQHEARGSAVCVCVSDNRTTIKTRKIDSFSEFIVMSKWKFVVYVNAKIN